MSRSGIQSAVPQQVNQALQIAGDQNLKRRQIDNAAMANAATAKNQAERTQAMLRGQDQDLFTNAANRDARFASQQIALKEAQISREQNDKLQRDKIAAEQQMNSERIALAEEEIKLKNDLAKQEMEKQKQIQIFENELALATGKSQEELKKQLEEARNDLANLHRQKRQVDQDQGLIQQEFTEATVQFEEDTENILRQYDGMDSTFANNLMPEDLEQEASPDRGSIESGLSYFMGIFGRNFQERDISKFISDPTNATNYLSSSFANSMLEIANSSDETTNANIQKFSNEIVRSLLANGKVEDDVFQRAEAAGVDPMLLQQGTRNFAKQYTALAQKYAVLKSYDSSEVDKDGRDTIVGLTGPLEGMTINDAALLKSVFNDRISSNLINGTSGFFDNESIRAQLKAMRSLSSRDSKADSIRKIMGVTGQEDSVDLFNELVSAMDVSEQDVLDLIAEIDDLEADTLVKSKMPDQSGVLEVLENRLKELNND